MKKKPRILITGPVPPPAGGISVHIGRLSSLLQDEFLFDFIDEGKDKKKEVFNIRSLNPIKYLKKIKKADVIFVHSGNTFFRLLELTVAKIFRRKSILTLHAYPYRKGNILFFIDNMVFNFAKKIIVVNEDILSRLNLPPEKYVVKNAFLPPVLAYEPELPGQLLQSIKNAKNDNKIIIVSNAFRLDNYNNEDLYGLDMCIEVTKRLVKKGIPVYFIFLVASITQGKERYDAGLKEIADLQIGNSFCLTNQSASFVKLIQESDIVVRPTNTDGDALSIREALSLNKPVLSSDVVVRPDGTHLFINRNFDDFEDKLEQLINKSCNSNTQTEVQTTDISGEYKLFYTNLINSVVYN